MAFASLIMKEMRLQGKSTIQKSLDQMLSELKESLIAEKDMNDLIKLISEASMHKDTMTRIMLFIPCIMHCKNRIDIKKFTMLLIQGLMNFQGARFHDLEEITSQKKREEMFLSMVEKEVCSKILGSLGNEAQWKLPVEKQSSGEEINLVIGPSMKNYKIRKIIENHDKIITNYILENDKKELFCTCLINYSKMMKVLRKKQAIILIRRLSNFKSTQTSFFRFGLISMEPKV